nr:BAF_HP1_G0053050.mRNA.1.CDS.1 [Saccharomyces cerevisiae]
MEINGCKSFQLYECCYPCCGCICLQFCVYASSRIIQALGASGQLPSVFLWPRKRRTRSSLGFFRPLFHFSSFFTWFCICMSQIRFRMALKAQGRSNDEIAYKSILGVYGGILG